MSTMVKVLLGLALVVPMGAYVAGSLIGSASTPVSGQTAVVVPAALEERVVEKGVRFERRPEPEPQPVPPPDDDADDGYDDGSGLGDDGVVEDDGVEVVTPEPQPVPPPAGDDDDDDDDGDDDDGGDDDDDEGGDDD